LRFFMKLADALFALAQLGHREVPSLVEADIHLRHGGGKTTAALSRSRGAPPPSTTLLGQILQ